MNIIPSPIYGKHRTGIHPLYTHTTSTKTLNSTHTPMDTDNEMGQFCRIDDALWTPFLAKSPILGKLQTPMDGPEVVWKRVLVDISRLSSTQWCVHNMECFWDIACLLVTRVDDGTPFMTTDRVNELWDVITLHHMEHIEEARALLCSLKILISE